MEKNLLNAVDFTLPLHYKDRPVSGLEGNFYVYCGHYKHTNCWPVSALRYLDVFVWDCDN